MFREKMFILSYFHMVYRQYDKGQVRVIGYMSYELDDSPADACQPLTISSLVATRQSSDACIALRSLLQAFQLAH